MIPMTAGQVGESVRAIDSGGRWSLEGSAPGGVEVVNDYLGYLSDRGYSPRTVRAYAFDLLAFVRWLASEGLAVQEVTTEGIIAEGLTTTHREHAAEVDLSFKFAELWDSIYAPKGLGWTDNPWVWCCEFRRVEA